MSENLYDVLGLKYNATKTEIKSAFKKLAGIYHPDVNHSKEAIAIFKKINFAKEILLDDVKKLQYDISMGFKTSDDTKTYKKEEKKEENTSPKNSKEPKSKGIFQDFFKNYDKNLKKQNGKDIEMEVKISYDEALMGTSRKINIVYSEKCEKCGGRKFINGTKCPVCNGSGEISTHKKVNVKIPKNVKEGSKIRLKGEGRKGINGGENGDLYLIIKIDKKPIEKDIKEVFITPYEAVLGTTIDIKTEKGTVRFNVPPNTNSSQKFKIVDKNSSNKEFFITIIIKMPKNITDDEILLYEKMAELNKNKNREELF